MESAEVLDLEHLCQRRSACADYRSLPLVPSQQPLNTAKEVELMGPENSDKEATIAFRAKKRRQVALLLFGLPFIVALGWFRVFPGQLNAAATGVAALVAIVYLAFAAIYSWRNWRCPRCNKWLGQDLAPPACKGCGIRFYL